jgi:hypothetical protein
MGVYDRAIGSGDPEPENMKSTVAGVSIIKLFRERYCVVAEGNQIGRYS